MLTTRTRRGAILVSVLALGIGSALAAPPANAAGPYDDKVVISQGHVDVLYPKPADDGGAVLQIHDDTVSPHAYRAPEDVVFHVKPSVAQRAANAYIAQIPDFVNTGDTIYVLPQTSVPGTIFAGFGHGFPTGTSVTHSITAMEGPGNFATWQSGEDGPSVNWNTAAGLPTSFSSFANHEHLSWGFTAPGEYALTVDTTVTTGGQDLHTGGTYTFWVGEELPEDAPGPDPDPDPAPTTTLSISGLSAHYHAGGVANLSAVQDPATGEDHYHWFTRAEGETEWKVVSGALGGSYGFIVRTADNGTEVIARLYDHDHNLIAESDPAVIVVDDHGNSPIEAMTITATLPVSEGALVVSVPEENRDVNLGDFALTASADRYVATGEMGAVHVTDTRSGNPGWTVNGRVRAFTTVDGDQLSGGHLGWAPKVLASSANQQVTAGASVDSVLSGGTGIQAWRTLGSASAGAGIGAAQLGGDLTLEAPLDLATGTYRGLLILTAI
ncbi:MAG TPA: choice-of-anchor M domain-containing protein [Arachnia sp.]|nr:choice-of-anchor M domain-containing protein [Arachnia sp.]